MRIYFIFMYNTQTHNSLMKAYAYIHPFLPHLYYICHKNKNQESIDIKVAFCELNIF